MEAVVPGRAGGRRHQKNDQKGMPVDVGTGGPCNPEEVSYQNEETRSEE